jgi:predicted MFS family arabinose efflux permease
VAKATADPDSRPATDGRQGAHRRLLAPLRGRDFRLFFLGQSSSNVGDAFYEVALPFAVLLHHSPADLGVVLSLYGIARAGGIVLSGRIIDVVGARMVMLTADAVRFVLVALLAISLLGPTPIWRFDLFAGLFGFATGAFKPAYSAMPRDLLEADGLQAGNALIIGGLQASSSIGPALGGIVMSAASAAGAFLVDALTFLVSTVSLLFVRGRSERRSIDAKRSDAQPRDPRGIFTLLAESGELRLMLVMVALINLTWGGMFEVALPVFVRSNLHAGVAGYGLFLTITAVGALTGAYAIGLTSNRRVWLAFAAGLLQAPFVALVGVTSSTAVVGVALFMAGFLNPIVNVMIMTYLQRRFPANLTGRVMSAVLFCAYGLFPVSTFIFSVLVQHAGASIAFPIAALGLALGFGFGLVRSRRWVHPEPLA